MMTEAEAPTQEGSSRGAALYAATVVLALCIPFESIYPVFSLPWFQVTNLELVLLATVLLWIAHIVSTARPLRMPRLDRQTLLASPVLISLLLFLSMAALSALFAPADRAEAIKSFSRLLLGGCIFLIVSRVASSRSRIALLLWALILSAGVSALLGLAEASEWPAVGPVLSLFKVDPTLVGGETRASASFQYATIASMYFEMVAPVAIAIAATSRRPPARIAALAVAAACSVLVVLTLTRTGIVAVTIVLGSVLLLSLTGRASRSLIWPAAFALLVLCSTLAVVLSSPNVVVRMTTENDVEWYNATYVAPDALTLRPGEQATVQVEVRNTGRVVWTAGGDRSFALGYRWGRVDGEKVHLESRGEVSLPHAVAPGESVLVEATVVSSLEPDNYLLIWDVLQRDVLWFSYRSVPEAVTHVRVVSETAPVATTVQKPAGRYDFPELPPLPPRTVSRGELWRAALVMTGERPILGNGPDSFRHLYGRYLGMVSWDERTHANNLYLEFLADLGMAGSVSFGMLMAAVLLPSLRRLRSLTGGPIQIWTVGVLASLLAFFVHGLLDYFLQFTPLYLLFWMLLGLVLALDRTRERARNSLPSD